MNIRYPRGALLGDAGIGSPLVRTSLKGHFIFGPGSIRKPAAKEARVLLGVSSSSFGSSLGSAPCIAPRTNVDKCFACFCQDSGIGTRKFSCTSLEIHIS